MLQKLPKFLKVAQKTASCPKVAEHLVDRAIVVGLFPKHAILFTRWAGSFKGEHVLCYS